MAVKLRLKRMGAKQKPFYRIVAADSRSPRDGRFIEVVGTYNPLKNPAEITVKEDRVLYWLNNGAQATDTVRSILSKNKVMEKYAASKAKPAKKEKKETKVAAEKKEAPKKTTTTKKTTTAKKAPAAKKTTKKEEK